LEKTAPKRWNAQEQRVGIAAAISAAITGALALCLVIAFKPIDPTEFHCQDATCIQTMWQGRWAMLSFFGAIALLFVTVISVRLVRASLNDARELQKREYRGYLAPLVKKITFYRETFMIEVKAKNYGRTPVKNIRFMFVVAVSQKNELVKSKPAQFVSADKFERKVIHPGKHVRIIPDIQLKNPVDIVDDLFEHGGAGNVSGIIEYTDTFGDTHIEDFITVIGNGYIEDGAYIMHALQ
jgi:hypothetical protein